MIRIASGVRDASGVRVACCLSNGIGCKPCKIDYNLVRQCWIPFETQGILCPNKAPGPLKLLGERLTSRMHRQRYSLLGVFEP